MSESDMDFDLGEKEAVSDAMRGVPGETRKTATEAGMVCKPGMRIWSGVRTQRDWYVGLAMAGMLANPAFSEWDEDLIARRAFNLADSVMDERKNWSSMKLWLIARTDKVDWDEYDSAVVAAETEEAARSTHPGGYGHDVSPALSWTTPDRITVKLIGEAVDGIGAGVVCASFNAG